METKKKVQQIRKYRNQTGGGPPCAIVLSEFDERIRSIIGETIADGDPALTEIGFDSSTMPIHSNQQRSKSMQQIAANPLAHMNDSGNMGNFHWKSCSKYHYFFVFCFERRRIFATK